MVGPANSYTLFETSELGQTKKPVPEIGQIRSQGLISSDFNDEYIETIQAVTYSQNVWSISPPSLNLILTRLLDPQYAFQLQVIITFTRDGPPLSKQVALQVPAQLINLDQVRFWSLLIVVRAFFMSPFVCFVLQKFQNQLASLLVNSSFIDYQNNTQIFLPLPNLNIPEYIHLTATSAVPVSVETFTYGLSFFNNTGVGDRWFTLTQVDPTSGRSNSKGVTFFTFSDPIIPVRVCFIF